MTPTLETRLLQLLPSDIQFLYGLVKQGDVVIDSQNQTITIVTPNPFNIDDIKFQQQFVEQYRNEYLQQIRTQSADPLEQMPENENMLFTDILKVYEQILQRLQ